MGGTRQMETESQAGCRLAGQRPELSGSAVLRSFARDSGPCASLLDLAFSGKGYAPRLLLSSPAPPPGHVGWAALLPAVTGRNALIIGFFPGWQIRKNPPLSPRSRTPARMARTSLR